MPGKFSGKKYAMYLYRKHKYIRKKLNEIQINKRTNHIHLLEDAKLLKHQLFIM